MVFCTSLVKKICSVLETAGNLLLPSISLAEVFFPLILKVIDLRTDSVFSMSRLCSSGWMAR